MGAGQISRQSQPCDAQPTLDCILVVSFGQIGYAAGEQLRHKRPALKGQGIGATGAVALYQTQAHQIFHFCLCNQVSQFFRAHILAPAQQPQSGHVPFAEQHAKKASFLRQTPKPPLRRSRRKSVFGVPNPSGAESTCCLRAVDRRKPQPIQALPGKTLILQGARRAKTQQAKSLNKKPFFVENLSGAC